MFSLILLNIFMFCISSDLLFYFAVFCFLSMYLRHHFNPPLLPLSIVLLVTKSSASDLPLSEKSIFQNLTVCCHGTIGWHQTIKAYIRPLLLQQRCVLIHCVLWYTRASTWLTFVGKKLYYVTHLHRNMYIFNWDALCRKKVLNH